MKRSDVGQEDILKIAAEDYLKLENQLCFPLYATSRMITRLYQPLLEKVGLTYPQYIVMLVLWEQGELPVKEIGLKLQLNTNTLTPLLKRMAELCLILRRRSKGDERVVMISLTEKGQSLKQQALAIPNELMASLNYPLEKAVELKALLDEFLESLNATGEAEQPTP